jgi:hypothetical protein
MLEDAVRPILDDVDPDDLLNENRFQSIVNGFEPVVKKRIILIRKLSGEDKNSDDNVISSSKSNRLHKMASGENSPTKHYGVPNLDTSNKLIHDPVVNPKILDLIKNYLVSSNKSNYGKLDSVTYKDKHGNNIQTNLNNISLANMVGSPTVLMKQLLAAGIGLAGLAVIFSDKPLLEKILSAIITGGAATTIIRNLTNTYKRDYIETPEHIEVPEHTVAYRVQKTAGSNSNGDGFLRKNFLATMGLIIPSAMVLDYLWNKHRYGVKGEEYTGSNLGPFEQKMVRAGRFVIDHPIATYGGTALGMVGIGEGVKSLFGAKKNK